MHKPKRPRDPNQLAKLIVDMATDEAPADTVADDGKNPAAAALGRLGGKARAKNMSKKARADGARKAALMRWAARSR